MKIAVALCTSLLLANLFLPIVARKDDDDGWCIPGLLTGAAAGVGVLIAAPVILPAVGFTSVGITAGSLGASMMSSAAIASGGGVAAGSTVAVLQSIGAAGLTVAGKVAIVGTGAVAGAALCGCNGKKDD